MLEPHRNAVSKFFDKNSIKFEKVLKIFSKKIKNGIDREGWLEMGWKFLKIFKQIDVLGRKIQANKERRLISIRQWKVRNWLAKFCVFLPKIKKIMKDFKWILRLFDRNLSVTKCSINFY